MDADSGNVKRLTRHPAEDASPVWGPNGHWIVFISGWVENYDIYRDKCGRHQSPPIDTPSGDGIWNRRGCQQFFPVSPTINTQATLWGRLKQSVQRLNEAHPIEED